MPDFHRSGISAQSSPTPEAVAPPEPLARLSYAETPSTRSGAGVLEKIALVGSRRFPLHGRFSAMCIRFEADIVFVPPGRSAGINSGRWAHCLLPRPIDNQIANPQTIFEQFTAISKGSGRPMSPTVCECNSQL